MSTKEEIEKDFGENTLTSSGEIRTIQDMWNAAIEYFIAGIAELFKDELEDFFIIVGFRSFREYVYAAPGVYFFLAFAKIIVYENIRAAVYNKTLRVFCRRAGRHIYVFETDNERPQAAFIFFAAAPVERNGPRV